MKRFYKIHKHDTHDIIIHKEATNFNTKNVFSDIKPPEEGAKLERLPYIKISNEACNNFPIDLDAEPPYSRFQKPITEKEIPKVLKKHIEIKTKLT